MDIYKAIDGTTIIHGKGSKVPFAACSISIIIPTGDNVGGAIVIDYVVSNSSTRNVIINGHVRLGNMLAFGGGSSGLCFGLGMSRIGLSPMSRDGSNVINSVRFGNGINGSVSVGGNGGNGTFLVFSTFDTRGVKRRFTFA